jgi:uncharacterized membrane protein
MSIYDPINFSKLVNRQLLEWRKIRLEKFKQLDIDFLRALETNDTNKKNKIIALKQELRDVTKFDFSSISLEEILTYYPDCLK